MSGVGQEPWIEELLVPDRIAVSCMLPWMHGTTITMDCSGQVISFRDRRAALARDDEFKTVNIYSFSRSTWRRVLRRLGQAITDSRVNEYYEVVLKEMVADGSGILTRQGDYQEVYRSVPTYASLFGKCGVSVDHMESNTPYLLMQMGCEFIKKWKTSVPEPIQAVPLVGGLTYAALRLGGALLTRLPDAMGIDFPELTNHFFVLRKNTDASPCSTLSS